MGEIALDALRDRVLVLRRMPQLADLEQDDLAPLAEHAHLLRPRVGTRLLEEGARLDRVFMLVEGTAEVSNRGRTTAIHGPRIVGLLELSAGVDKAPGLVCKNNALVLELPAEVMLNVLYENPAVTRNVLRLAARGLLAGRGNLPFKQGEAPEPAEGTWSTRMPTLVERVLALRRAPVWASANLDALAEIAKHIEERRVEPGTALWQIGDEATHSIRVEYGIVRCTNDSGESVRVGSGVQLGALDSLTGMPRAYQAVTETRAILYTVRASTQLAVIEVHTQLAARLRTQLSKALLESRETPRISE